MADLSGFDATEIEPQQSYDVLPAGNYECVVTDSEMKQTRNNSGEYLELSLQVIAGDHEGRRLWARLNLKNASQDAVEIAQRQLSALCHAVGVLRPRGSEDLHDKPFIAKVACKKRNDTGEMTNEVKGFSKVGQGGGAAEPAPAAKSGDRTPPWKR